MKNQSKYLKLASAIVLVVIVIIVSNYFYGVKQKADTEIHYDNLKPLVDGQVQLVLFHNEKRCQQCLEMEEMARELLLENFKRQLDDESLIFKTAVIDVPQNRDLVDQLGIFGTTLVLMEFDNDSLVYARVLTRGAELASDKTKFRNYVSSQLSEIFEGSAM
jgi:hypothetical protein